jgi:predicted Rossmann fold nucleotide-binding protein DprA/Smf involved in DNA uptake
LLPLLSEVPQEVCGFSGSQQQLLRLIGYECITVDELARLSAVPVSRVMADLTLLEIRGAVARCEGGYIRS